MKFLLGYNINIDISLGDKNLMGAFFLVERNEQTFS